MAFWKKKKYCQYCGSALNSDGTCPNKDCIAYVAPTTDTTTTTTTTDAAQNGGK